MTIKTVEDMIWNIPNSSDIEFNTPLFGENPHDDMTTMWIEPSEIEDKIQYLFELGKTEIFEVGIENRFSQHLYQLVYKYGKEAIALLSEAITQNKYTISPLVAGQILKLLGEVDNPSLKNWVYAALMRGLKSKYIDVKDGAILGLAALDDPKAISELSIAIGNEKNTELREDMEQVLEQLIQTREEHG